MSLHLRDAPYGGPVYTHAERSVGAPSVRVSETVYIDEGDAVAVVVAKTALGVVPLIVPMQGGNRRPLPARPTRSRHPTIPAPAPAAMEPRNPASRSAPPHPATAQKRTPWRATIRPTGTNE